MLGLYGLLNLSVFCIVLNTKDNDFYTSVAFALVL